MHASVSHSGDLVVVATTAAGPVGVDVERLGGRPSAALTPMVCSAAEHSFVRTPEDLFTYWVRKEAILKATGDGMQMEMTNVTVSQPHRPPSLLSVMGRTPPPCAMADLEADGYKGAVAVLAPHGVEFAFLDAGGAGLLGA